MNETKRPIRIFVAETPSFLRPRSSPFRYPSYSRDWGIEQDFLDFLLHHYPHTVGSPEEADFVYLPVFWTRYHLSNDFGQRGLAELAEALEPVLAYPYPKFAICQYDDGPLVGLGETVTFLASRNSEDGRDAPLLTSPIPRPWGKVDRRFAASFVGRTGTHPLREELKRKLSTRDDIVFAESTLSARRYAKTMLSASIAISPRGYGGSSFRFYEAIHLGIVPWLIGEYDTRPFKALLDWDSFSFYSHSVDDFLERFDAVDTLDLEGKKSRLRQAANVMRFGKWAPLLLEELRLLGEQL